MVKSVFVENSGNYSCWYFTINFKFVHCCFFFYSAQLKCVGHWDDLQSSTSLILVENTSLNEGKAF